MLGASPVPILTVIARAASRFLNRQLLPLGDCERPRCSSILELSWKIPSRSVAHAARTFFAIARGDCRTVTRASARAARSSCSLMRTRPIQTSSERCDWRGAHERNCVKARAGIRERLQPLRGNIAAARYRTPGASKKRTAIEPPPLVAVRLTAQADTGRSIVKPLAGRLITPAGNREARPRRHVHGRASGCGLACVGMALCCGGRRSEHDDQQAKCQNNAHRICS